MNRSPLAIAALLLAAAALAVPAPNPFLSGWANPLDPDRDCKIRRGNGALIIEMPGGDHDYDPHRERFNAPRLLREFEGDFEMQVRVQLHCRPCTGSSYVGAGFLLIFPDDFCTRCIRLEYRVTGQGDEADGCVVEMVRNSFGGRLDGVWDKRRRNWPFKTRPEHVYLRLERQGHILGHEISPDGKTWMSVGGGGFSGLPSKLKVGLAAYSTSSEPSKVRFDQLWLTRGKRNKR